MHIFDVRHLVSQRVWDRGNKVTGRIVQYRVGNFKLSGYVLASQADRYMYNPWLAADGTFYCDCQGFETAETI